MEIFIVSDINKVENIEKIRKGMERLWKDTFHDSDAYIRLIFDGYFKEGMKGYVLENGNLIAGMLGIPYQFELMNEEEPGGMRRASGLYLCGLATAPEYRKQGIMERLIEHAEEEAKKSGYDFLFLIPANDHLRKYYSRFNFEDAFPKWEGVLCDRDDGNRLESFENSQSLRIEYFESYDCVIENIENSQTGGFCQFVRDYNQMERLKEGSVDWQMIKSERDLKLAIRECVLSGGKIYLVKDSESQIKGIAFIYKEGEKECKIYKISVKDKEVRDLLIRRIAADYPECKIVIFGRFPEEGGKGEEMWHGMIKNLSSQLEKVEFEQIRDSELSLMLD